MIRIHDFALFRHDAAELDDEVTRELGRVAARERRDKRLLKDAGFLLAACHGEVRHVNAVDPAPDPFAGLTYELAPVLVRLELSGQPQPPAIKANLQAPVQRMGLVDVSREDGCPPTADQGRVCGLRGTGVRAAHVPRQRRTATLYPAALDGGKPGPCRPGSPPDSTPSSGLLPVRDRFFSDRDG